MPQALISRMIPPVSTDDAEVSEAYWGQLVAAGHTDTLFLFNHGKHGNHGNIGAALVGHPARRVAGKHITHRNDG